MSDGAAQSPPRSEGVSSAGDEGGRAEAPRADTDDAAQPTSAGDEGSPNGQPPGNRRTRVISLFERLIQAIRQGDDDQVERAVLSLSQRSRLLAPLALVVGAFAVLFQGIKLLVTNWRLTLIQILPAMWIWLAMLNLKGHVLRGRQFDIVRGPLLIVLLLVVMAITAAAFFLNAVFGFAIAKPGEPEIRPAYAEARSHLGTILAWGGAIGLALGYSGLVVTRWGLGWFTLSFGIVTGVMMFAYVALPSRLLGLQPGMSRRDKLTTSAVGGAVGVLVCSPPYWLGRLAIVMLGSAALRVPAIIVLAIAIVLQTGATSAIKAVKMSAKIVAGRAPEESELATSSGSPAETGVASPGRDVAS
jgi:hypothetical protein